MSLFFEDKPRVKASKRSSAGMVPGTVRAPRRSVSRNDARPIPPLPETSWRLPDGPDAFPSLEGADEISIDCETYDPDLKSKGPGVRRDGYVCGVSVGTDTGFRQYYPIAHAVGENLDKKKVFGWLKDELKRRHQPKVGANLLYDLDYLAENGVEVDGPCWDVQNAEPLLDENALSYSLGTLGKKYLGEGKKDDAMSDWMKRAFGDEENIKKNIWRVPAAVVADYAIGDIDMPLRIIHKQRDQMEKEKILKLFDDVETPLTPMLLAMRRRGVRVDVEKAIQLKDTFDTRFGEAMKEIKRLSGVTLGSPWEGPAIGAMLDRNGIDVPRTEKGAYSIQKPWLKVIARKSKIAAAVLDARALDKFKGTFLQSYIIDGAILGRLHTLFHQLRNDENGTVSGRFSSSDPNLQNIPQRDPILGPLIRALFTPEEGQHWWKFDWSQIEYRIIVHYACCHSLTGAESAASLYREDPTTDFHQMVAEMVGIPRGDAKNLNFGMAYGQGLDLLCSILGVTKERGREILDTYHGRAPFIHELSDLVQKFIRKHGYIPTLLKRRRRFEMWEKNGKFSREQTFGAQRAFVYAGLNALIQGSAADLMKKAMVKIWDSGVCDILGAPHLTVHDELDGSYDRRDPAAKMALLEIRRIMQTCIQLRVPIIADMKTGINWGNLGE